MNLLGFKYDQPDKKTVSDISPAYFRLLFFSISLCLLTYGFRLGNFSVTIDDLKAACKKGLWFIALIIVSVVLYFILIKIFCPSVRSDGFLLPYITENSDHLFTHFFYLWGKHLIGVAYYGDRTFIVATVIAVVMGIKFLSGKGKLWLLRIVMLYYIGRRLTSLV